MAKVILLCGKICCGKSTYAKSICKSTKAVCLSADEIMLSVFGQDIGEKHDGYVNRVKEYLYSKSTELIEVGIDVIMDLGLWSKAERDKARNFYCSRNIVNEIHYLDISDNEWRSRIEKRNSQMINGKTGAYLIDTGLSEKADMLFEKPDKSGVDVWITI